MPIYTYMSYYYILCDRYATDRPSSGDPVCVRHTTDRPTPVPVCVSGVGDSVNLPNAGRGHINCDGNEEGEGPLRRCLHELNLLAKQRVVNLHAGMHHPDRATLAMTHE